MRRLIITTTFALAVCGFAWPASAVSGLGFLAESPIAYFTPEDSRLLKQTLFDLLDNQADGATARWKNPNTGHRGRMQVLRSFQHDGHRCRTVRAQNHAGGRRGQAQFDFCKMDHGTWRIAHTQ